MATLITNNFRTAQMGAGNHGQIDFDTDTISIALVDNTTYTVVVTTEDYADLSAAVHGGKVALASTTVGSVATGVFDAANATFSSVASGPTDLNQLALFKWSGTASTSPVTHAYDSATTGLPVVPNGGDIAVAWNASGILEI